MTRRMQHEPVARPELTKLIKDSIAAFEAMSPDEQEALLRVQRAGYVKAEMEMDWLEREEARENHRGGPKP